MKTTKLMQGVTAAVMAVALSGCGPTGLTVSVKGESETRATFKKAKPAGASATSAAKGAAVLPEGFRPGPGSALGTPATAPVGASGGASGADADAAAAPTAGSPAQGVPATAPKAGVAGGDAEAARPGAGPRADGPAEEAAPIAPPMVEVLSAPTRALRVFPMYVAVASEEAAAAAAEAEEDLEAGAEDALPAGVTMEFDDAEFAPEDGVLTWTVKAPAAGLKVAQVKVVFTGGGSPIEASGTPDQYDLPAVLAGEMTLGMPFATVDTFQALAATPRGVDLRATYTFIGEDGEPIRGAGGEPLALTTKIDVM